MVQNNLRHSGAVVIIVAWEQWDQRFFVCVEFACSAGPCVGSLQVLKSFLQSRDLQVGRIGNSELAEGVSTSGNGCDKQATCQGLCSITIAEIGWSTHYDRVQEKQL